MKSELIPVASLIGDSPRLAVDIVRRHARDLTVKRGKVVYFETQDAQKIIDRIHVQARSTSAGTNTAKVLGALSFYAESYPQRPKPGPFRRLWRWLSAPNAHP